MQNLTGIWEGEYSLLDDTLEKPEMEYHSFKLELKDVDCELSGRCFDLTLEDEPSTVNGFHDETGLISFIKKYRRLIFTDDIGNYFGDDTIDHPDINYYGRYNKKEDVFEGHWEIHESEEHIGLQEEFVDRYFNGQWFMRLIKKHL